MDKNTEKDIYVYRQRWLEWVDLQSNSIPKREALLDFKTAEDQSACPRCRRKALKNK